MIVTVAVRGIVRALVAAPANPFAEFADLFPGQPLNTLQVQGMFCRESGLDEAHLFEVYCSWQPEADPVSSVRLITYKGVIVQLGFVVRDQTLRIGDVAAWLETSEYEVYLNTALFLLPELFVVVKTTSNAGQISPDLPVTFVSFANYELPVLYRCVLLTERSFCSSEQ